jgi:aerobic carbon-monoxide dehydrogenase large subunit
MGAGPRCRYRAAFGSARLLRWQIIRRKDILSGQRRDTDGPEEGRKEIQTRFVGTHVRRKEDRRLLTGMGRFVADLNLPGTLDMAVLRSPVAHAQILDVEVGDALRLDGVVLAVTGRDLEGKVSPFTRFVDQEDTPPSLEAAVHPVVLRCPMEVLPTDRVRYVGQAVAVVVAESRHLAEDALELVRFEYQELQVLTDPEQAVMAGAPILHEHLGTNVQAHFEVEVGDPDSAFASADGAVSGRVIVPRAAGSPLETRGVVATWDEGREELTVWSSTQVPFMVRTRICEMLGLVEAQVRVVAPDVGGGFGPKVNIYPEEILVAHLARELRRPVRWIEDRREHMLSTGQGRGQVHQVEAAYMRDGRITAIRDRFLLDCGAYNPFSLTCAYNTAAHFRGMYGIPNFRARGECVLTNKVVNVPYRGAGRPEAVFAMEAILEMVAAELEMDPAQVRFANLVPPDAMPYEMGMPYRDGVPIIYDGGDYPAALRKALELAGYEEIRECQPQWRAAGRRVGVGMACYVEGTGIGPHEGCRVRLDATGQVVVAVGSAPHGQSHETTFAQVCADELGIDPSRVTVRAGDTALLSHGVGTFASRSAVVAGTAVQQASGRLRERILAVAAAVLEVDSNDLVIENGSVHPTGVPSQNLSLAEVARAAAPGPRSRLPEGMDAGLEVTYFFVPPTVTFSYGAAVAVVEVDPELGTVEVLKYAVVHDCGTPINPTVVEGQIAGGVAQGIGAGLYEECIYDQSGQPLTTTFMDYLLPTTMEMPPLLQAHQETPSPRNPLGVRGVGEGGAITPPAAIAHAVADALRPLRVRFQQIPLTPDRVLSAIEAAESALSKAQS